MTDTDNIQEPANSDADVLENDARNGFDEEPAEEASDSIVLSES